MSFGLGQSREKGRDEREEWSPKKGFLFFCLFLLIVCWTSLSTDDFFKGYVVPISAGIRPWPPRSLIFDEGSETIRDSCMF